MKVLLDTNVLMLPGQFRVDIFPLLEDWNAKPYTLSLVVDELEKLSKKKGKSATYARVGLLLLKQNGVRILPAKGGADAQLVRIAKEKGFAVATQDRPLITRLKKKKVPILTLRQKRVFIKK